MAPHGRCYKIIVPTCKQALHNIILGVFKLSLFLNAKPKLYISSMVVPGSFVAVKFEHVKKHRATRKGVGPVTVYIAEVSLELL